MSSQVTSHAAGTTAASRRSRVLVVGAGFGGLAVVRALRAAGEDDVLVVEAGAGVGGTWRRNRYPGVACDAPSHVYSFAQRPGRWTRRFAPGEEVLAYLEDCAAELGLDARALFSTRVESARWTGDRWEAGLSDGTSVVCEVLVLATGQLDRPSVPDLPGLATFPGPVVHTARWRDDLDLASLRVGVVGTGASAVQVVPALAGRVGRLTVFQRSPAYVFDKPDTAYRPLTRRLQQRVPLATRVPRALIATAFELLSRAFW